MDMTLLRELVVIFALSVPVIYLCHRLTIPPIVGFLITGVVCGPYGLGLVPDVEQVEMVSEVGIVLLMFTIGMELSVRELIRLRKPVFLGGTLQVGLTIGLFAGLALAVGAYPGQGVFMGCLAALSSTAIVMSLLQRQGEAESPQGRISLSMLIYQDLVTVPMMLAIPFLAGAGSPHGHEGGLHLLLEGGKTLALILALFVLSRKAVPIIFRLVMSTRSRELFLVATLGICFAIAYLTSLMGLSLSLGAFLAGLIIAESEYSFSAMEGVLPFKDVFTSLFFTSVGMLLNSAFLVEHILPVLGLVALLMVGKSLVASAVTLILGYPVRVAVITGVALSQIGEFSFVLSREGMKYSLISDNGYQFFLAASILTMALMPFALRASYRLADLLADSALARKLFAGREAATKSGQDTSTESGHLVIVGYGLSGRYLARAARENSIDYRVLDLNPDIVHRNAAKGVPILYGDAIHPAVLEKTGVARAKVLAVLIHDPIAIRTIIDAARRMAPNLVIITRSRYVDEVKDLHSLGADEVVPDDLETSVEVFTRVLCRYLVPSDAIDRFTASIRSETYASKRKRHDPETVLGRLERSLPDFDVQAIRVEANAPLAGKLLAQSGLRSKHSLSVVAVQRGGAIIPNPDGDTALMPDDIAYVLGNRSALAGAGLLFKAPAPDPVVSPS